MKLKISGETEAIQNGPFGKVFDNIIDFIQKDYDLRTTGTVMFRIEHFAFTIICSLPMSALADCTDFYGYNAEGNWHSAIEERVEDALRCDRWAEDFDLSSLNHAQGFIVQKLLSEQREDEAIAKAKGFFEDAIQRYRSIVSGPNYRMTSNLEQTGMLFADVQSLFRSCQDNSAIVELMKFMQDSVRADVEKIGARAEEARNDLEQRLEDYSLEEWQEYYPEATSKEDLRDIEELRNVLKSFDAKSATYRLIDTHFMSLFTTTLRVENGEAEQCLAIRFINSPEVADLDDHSKRLDSFPRTSRFIARHGLQ